MVKRGRVGAGVARPTIIASLIVGTMAVAGDAGAAPIQAYAILNPPATGNQTAFAGTLALDFQVNMPITISELGVFDSGGLGLSNSFTVSIFASDNSTVLATANVPSGTGASLMDGYRFVTPSAGAFNLAVGTYSVVTGGFNASDPNGNRNIGGFPQLVTNDGSGLISFVSSRFGGPPGAGNLDGPCDGLAGSCYAAGSFKFEAQQAPPMDIPAPATLPVVALGVGALALASTRRRRTTP